MRRAIGNLQLSMVSIGLCVGLWEICNCREEVVVGEILKLMDQVCSLMETIMRHRAGDRELPMGLPRS